MAKQKIDSTHEKYFEWWAAEAMNKGLIRDVRRGVPVEITERAAIPYLKHLKTKSIESEKFLFHPHTYTPDYVIYWNGDSVLHDDIWSLSSKSSAFFWSQMNGAAAIGMGTGYVSVIDVKPDRIGRNTQHSSYTFPINQKLMWDIYDCYVQKVVLFPATNSKGNNPTLFTQTWTPEKLLVDPDWVYKRDSKWGKAGESKIKWKIRKLKDWL